MSEARQFHTVRERLQAEGLLDAEYQLTEAGKAAVRGVLDTLLPVREQADA